MKINNPLQMNNWEINRFLKVVLAIQIAMWGVIGMDIIGFEIPILRPLIGFIYLIFLPGILILRVLKLHKLGNIETILYAVGLSITTLMFTGLVINTIYPIFGISRTISVLTLTITISVIVLILCILSYMRDRDFSHSNFIDVAEIISPPVLFLCLIPFGAIFGAYLQNFHQSNILLMLFIGIIAILVILIGFNKFIPTNLYPFAIFIIALSLLYHNSLITTYIWGWDIHAEYYISNLIMENFRWDPTIHSAINAMMSTVMLAPIFSNVCNISLIWVFKVMYQLIFSLVPLGLYQVFQKQTDDKIAFFSCFFFISLFTFYGEMVTLPRQQIGELFLVLLIMVLMNKNIDKITRSFLLIIFGFSLTVSHYALSYYYMFCIILVYLILIFIDSTAIQILGDYFYFKFGIKGDKFAGDKKSPEVKRIISSSIVLLFVTSTLTWYIYIANSSTFFSIVYVCNRIAFNIFRELFNLQTIQGLNLVIGGTASLLHSATKYIHLLSIFFIIVGGIAVLLKSKKMKFEKEYIVLIILNYGILFASLTIPYFSSALQTTRVYQITLIFLAPLCVIGGIIVIKTVGDFLRVFRTKPDFETQFRVLSVFFAIFLLLNTGFVYEVADDNPSSISLSNAGYTWFNEQEVLTGTWIRDKKNIDTKVYSDVFKGLLLYGMLGESNLFVGGVNKTIDIPLNSYYIFLGRGSVKNGTIILMDRQQIESIDIQNTTFLLNMDKIYNNDDAEMYYR